MTEEEVRALMAELHERIGRLHQIGDTLGLTEVEQLAHQCLVLLWEYQARLMRDWIV